MNIDDIIKKYPDLTKITEEVIIQVSQKKFGLILDFNKTFSENGFDDLDCIELIMEIEKILEISVSDEVIDILFNANIKPPKLKEYFRNKKLRDIGI
jgi:acyl carrier protein